MHGVHIYYIYVIYVDYLFIIVIFHMLYDNDDLKNQMTSFLRKHWGACDIFQLFLGLSQDGMLLILRMLSHVMPKITTIPLKHSVSFQSIRFRKP